MAKKKQTSARQAWDAYLEAQRLHLWFSKSDFSFHQSKADPIEAEKWRRVAQDRFEEYMSKRARRAA